MLSLRLRGLQAKKDSEQKKNQEVTRQIERRKPRKCQSCHRQANQGTKPTLADDNGEGNCQADQCLYTSPSSYGLESSGRKKFGATRSPTRPLPESSLSQLCYCLSLLCGLL